jgi:NADP-dependent 3-hydroxy acid dehydrogenase YdfG
LASSSASGASESASALHGRSALVTGASRGIGRAIAIALAEQGASVHLLARTKADLDAVADEIVAATFVHVCDVTDADSVARVTSSIASVTNGTPDVLVNNAGLFPLASLEHIDPTEFERTIAANLVAPFRILRAFLPAMRARGSGHVVTIGSVADRSIFPGNGAYSASKFGQRAMHETLRAELRGSGVRATLVSPSATDTPIWDPVDPDNNAGFPKRSEMLRAEQVAEAVLWAVMRAPTVNVDEIRLSSS